MASLVLLLIQLLDIYLWVIIASAMASWLVAFGVLNMGNKWVYKGIFFLNRVTEPVYRRIRRFVPPIGGMDLSPLVVIFGIYFLKSALISVLM